MFKNLSVGSLSGARKMLSIITEKDKTVCQNEPTVLSIALELLEQVHQPLFPFPDKQDFENNDYILIRAMVKKLRTWASEKDWA